MTWSAVRQVAFKNIAATPASFKLRGGSYGVQVQATPAGQWHCSVYPRMDRPSSLALTAFSANGYASVNLPAGTYQLAIATATAVYADITGIVTTL